MASSRKQIRIQSSDVFQECLKVPLQAKICFLLVPAAEYLSLTVYRHVYAEFDTGKLFSHSSAEDEFPLCSLVLRGGPTSMICDITNVPTAVQT